MVRWNRIFALIGTAILMVSAFQNCGQEVSFQHGADNFSESLAFGVASANQFVCQPFGSGAAGSGNASSRGGLRASLRYLDQSQFVSAAEMSAQNIADYYAAGNPKVITTAQELYFNDVNVPTRAFTSGFAQSNGQLLTDNVGQPLVEYFSVEYNSIFKLRSGQANGYYRFAVLSDDGSTLEYQTSNGQWASLINNDQAHSTKMGCAANGIYLDAASKLTIRLRYFQGPRTQIANVMMIQFLGNTATPPTEVLCAQEGTDKFWNSMSVPQQAVLDLQSRNWAPPTADNFVLPNNQVNPCANSNAISVSAVEMKSTFDNKLRVSFKTNVKTTVHSILKDENDKIIAENTESAEATAHEIRTEPLDLKKPYKLELDLTSKALGISVHQSYLLTP